MKKNLAEGSFLSQEEIKLKTFKRIEEINAYVYKEIIIPVGFEIDPEGLWYTENKENKHPLKEWVSSSLWITGYTRDHNNENHGRVLEFMDIDNHLHTWTMPMELLSGDGSKILSALWNMGLQISVKRKAKEKLLEYIQRCKPTQRFRCVLQCGWYNKAFILPDQTFGYISKERIVFQNPTFIDCGLKESGSIEEWQKNVACKANGNSKLILALCASFSGPLLHLLNHANIGLHFRGSSSLGKSTALQVANSVWGDSSGIQTFRATANGLEGIASLHNDRLLCLDELGQISPVEGGHVIYMLGNGLGKGRANTLGLARMQARWRLVYLSTGELSLSQLMEEGGKNIKAGQEVRFIDIPADTGKYGLFENLHEFSCGADFSKHLHDSSKKYYGCASRVWLKCLVENIDEVESILKMTISEISQRYLPVDSSPQVIRVFNNFALLAAAGELASKFQITGWKNEVAIEGVMKNFNDWVGDRGSHGLYEEKNALSQVKSFFELHGESRFSPWNREIDDRSRTINRAGFKKDESKGVEFYVYIEIFRKEICRGLDCRLVEKLCIKRGYLVPDIEGNATRPEALPGNSKTTRCYKFTSKILNE